MAVEKRWARIPAQLISSNGTVDGHIGVPNSLIFKVKQKVIISSNTITAPFLLEIKKINSLTDMELGPVSGDINIRTDLTSVLTADSAIIFYDTQTRATISWEDIRRAVYEEEPTVALRTILVDALGDKYSAANPFPVDASINVDNLSVDITNPGNPTTYNIAVPDANTEQSFTFPIKTKRFSMRIRGGEAKIQISYVSGESGTIYFTNEMGNIYNSGDIDPVDPLTVYFQCSKDNKIIEIQSWANV